MTTLHDEIKLPPLPKNMANIVRRIRACESEVPAQVVLEHCLTEYASHTAAELALASDARIAELEFQLRQSWDVLHNVRDYTQTDMDVIIPEQMGAIEKTLKGQP